MGPGSRSLRSLVRDDVNFAFEFVDSFSTSKEGFKSSLRANGSRECAPDDRLREAIHGATK
jgi:hypothetical protein